MNNLNNKLMVKKVLVIDDNEMDRFIATRIIQRSGFAGETVVKESAANALEYLESIIKESATAPDVIFLDIRMPEMDGFGFLDSFAKLPASFTGKCKIIMLSTTAHPEDHKRIIESSYVSCLLNKPLDQAKLDTILSRGLN